MSAVKLQFLQQLDGIHVHTELGLGTAHTQIVVGNAEVLCFGNRLGRFRFFRADRLHHNIVGHIVLLTGVNRNRVCYELGGFFRCLCHFHFFHVASHKGNGFRAENGEPGGIGESNVLEVDRAGGKIHPIHHKGSAVNLKGGLTGNQMILGLLIANTFAIEPFVTSETAGQRIVAAANAVFLFQKCGLFLGCGVCLVEIVDSAFAALEVTAASQCLVNFILCDESADLGDGSHFRGIDFPG